MFSVKNRYIFILLLSAYSYFNIEFTEASRLFGLELAPSLLLAGITFIVIAVWEQNRLLEKIARRISKRFKQSTHPLIVLFLLSLPLTAAITLSTLYAIVHLFSTFETIRFLQIKLSLGFAFRINLFLHCLNAIVFYMEKFRRTQFETEQLKKQTIEARFEALRSQINPHFLFNSFNVLSTLVYKDADTSSRFIEQLSNVYRYLLYNQEQKVVPLQQEMDFLQSYIYLLKIRFQENLQIENQISEKTYGKYIAPATLQMLIENAIKHNVVSRENPLTIHLSVDNDYLVIKNNFQPKKTAEPSTGIGLQNIKDRYRFLIPKDTFIIQNNGAFTVKVPLIEVNTQ